MISTPQVVAWLMTYSLHSTLLLAAVWCATRFVRRIEHHPAIRDLLWKITILAPVSTATIQVFVGVGWFTLAPPIGAFGDPARPTPVSGLLEESVSDHGLSKGVGTSPATMHPSIKTSSRSENLQAAGVLLWLVGAIAVLGRRIIRLRWIRGLVADREAIKEPETRRRLDEIRWRLAVTHHIRLSSCRALPTPVVLSAREVCVPERALVDLSEGEWLALLGHEVAHISRRDPFWLNAIGWVQAVFFFQVLNRVAVSEVRRATEEECDRMTVQLLQEGRALASCLLKVAAWSAPSLHPLALPTMVSRRKACDSRISRLLQPGVKEWASRSLPRKARLAICTGVIVSLVAVGPGIDREALASPRTITSIQPGPVSGLLPPRNVDAADKVWSAHGALLRTYADVIDQAEILAVRGRTPTSVLDQLTALLSAPEADLYVQLDGTVNGARLRFVPSYEGYVGLRAEGLSLSLGSWNDDRDVLAVLAVNESRHDRTEYVVTVPSRALRVTIAVGDRILVDRVALDLRNGVKSYELTSGSRDSASHSSGE